VCERVTAAHVHTLTSRVRTRNYFAYPHHTAHDTCEPATAAHKHTRTSHARMPAIVAHTHTLTPIPPHTHNSPAVNVSCYFFSISACFFDRSLADVSVDELGADGQAQALKESPAKKAARRGHRRTNSAPVFLSEFHTLQVRHARSWLLRWRRWRWWWW
jgi:hypothetical protein